MELFFYWGWWLPGEGRKDDVKASVYMPRNEHVGYKIDAAKDWV